MGCVLRRASVHASTDDSLWRAAAIASSDALEAFIGTWLLTRGVKFDVRLPSLLDYLRLILLGGGVSIAISALSVNALLLFSGILTPRTICRACCNGG